MLFPLLNPENTFGQPHPEPDFENDVAQKHREKSSQEDTNPFSVLKTQQRKNDDEGRDRKAKFFKEEKIEKEVSENPRTLFPPLSELQHHLLLADAFDKDDEGKACQKRGRPKRYKTRPWIAKASNSQGKGLNAETGSQCKEKTTCNQIV
jgi:hypothetical protein